jgi:VanZ family protein
VQRAANVTGRQEVWISATILLSGAALLTLAVLGKRMAARRSRLEADANGRLMLFGLVVSVASVLAATLVPEGGREDRLLLNPIDGIDELQALGNVILFMPLGGFLRLKGTSRRKTLLGALAFSTTIEMLQFFLIQGRAASTSDVILNTTGAVLGHVLAGRAQISAGS